MNALPVHTAAPEWWLNKWAEDWRRRCAERAQNDHADHADHAEDGTR